MYSIINYLGCTIAELWVATKKETQFNRKVELNVELKGLEKQRFNLVRKE
jgi:hypothetical protein